MTSDPAKHAWQASAATAGSPSLEKVRKDADKLYRNITRRNGIEYVACALALVLFTYQLFTAPTALHQVGWVLLIGAVIYMPWQLYRRTSPASPDLAGTMPIYVFQRAQLVRQRDGLTSMFRWYFVPLLPGFATIIAANGLDPEIEAAGPPIWQRWLALAVMGAFFGFYWWLTKAAARRMQRRIDEIDAVMGGDE